MKRPAFTLIELLIVAAVFGLTALLATSVFANIQSTQRAVQSQDRVTTDGRYLMETIARSVRTGTINYNAYGAGGVAGTVETKLAIIEADNTFTCYEYVSGPPGSVTLRTGAASDCTGGTASTLSPADISVTRLSFFISPKSDPYRPLARSAADCGTNPAIGSPVVEGYDSTKGVCVCQQPAAGNATGCFTDQLCTSTANPGVGCVTGEANCICKNPNVQPHVTIYLRTQTASGATREKGDQVLQTTVVSRSYQR